jgi:Vitamin K-dependent gamma-carboxylase
LIDQAFAHPDSAIQASSALVGVAALVSSLEWLAVRREFAAGSCFAWELGRSRKVLLRHPAVDRALSLVLDPPGLVGLLLLRAMSGLYLVVAGIAALPLVVPLLIVGVSTILLMYRQLWGLDGSDQMIAVIVVALAMGMILGVEALAVAFVGAQVVAAYFIAGMEKLRGLDWRVGTAIPSILSTSSFGVPSLGAALRERRWAGRGLTWTTMSFEFVFPLALLAPTQVFVGFLVAGALFHVGTAMTMGLNVFLWAFLAGYP